MIQCRPEFQNFRDKKLKIKNEKKKKSYNQTILGDDNPYVPGTWKEKVGGHDMHLVHSIHSGWKIDQPPYTSNLATEVDPIEPR